MTTTELQYSVTSYAGPFRDQNPYGSCGPHALWETVWNMTNQSGPTPKNISIYFNYGDARLASGTFYSDVGVGSIGDSMSLMMGKIHGLADASMWANDPGYMYMMPTQTVYDNAATFKIGSYRQLDPYAGSGTWQKNIETELSHGKPLIAGVDDFYGLGRHFFVIEKNDDTTQSWIYKNSWGPDFEDHGYGSWAYSKSIKFAGVYVIDELGGKNYKWDADTSAVLRTYADVFGRSAELPGARFWEAQVKAGMSQKELIKTFVESQEGQIRFGALDNDHRAATVFHDMTGREARQVDIDAFSDKLDHGMSLDALIKLFDDWVGNGNDGAVSQARLHDMELISGRYAIAAQQIDGGHAAHVPMDAVHGGMTVDAAMIGVYHTLGW